MSEVKRTERGWAGHFCAARDCQFRRNTLLEKDGRGIVVSTVGAYRLGPGGKFEEIGLDRHYETMAFRADMGDVYRDADVSCEIGFSSPWRISITPENTRCVDNLADQMHEAVVAEIAADFDAKWESGKSWHDGADGN